MSSVIASAIRRLEDVFEKVKNNFILLVRCPSGFLESTMVHTIRFGSRAENTIVRLSMRVSRYFDRLQKSLYKSTILASLWIGLLFTLSLLIIAVLILIGG